MVSTVNGVRDKREVASGRSCLEASLEHSNGAFSIQVSLPLLICRLHGSVYAAAKVLVRSHMSICSATAPALLYLLHPCSRPSLCAVPPH